jgi:hypothetical protein
MEPRRRRLGWGWWSAGYGLLVLAMFAGYRWVKDGPPGWLASLLPSRLEVKGAEGRRPLSASDTLLPTSLRLSAFRSKDTLAIPDAALVKRVVIRTLPDAPSLKLDKDEPEAGKAKVIEDGKAIRRLLAFLGTRRRGWKPWSITPPAHKYGVVLTDEKGNPLLVVTIGDTWLGATPTRPSDGFQYHRDLSKKDWAKLLDILGVPHP